MEQGAAKLAKILAFALLLGIAVTAFNPAYRQALLAIAQGKPAESPIWKSNIDYYPDIVLPGQTASSTSVAPATSLPATDHP